MAESLRFATDLFLPSLGRFEGVEGVPDDVGIALEGTAVGRARKNLCEKLGVSSALTTTAAAPAVYAKIREDARQSKAVGDDTVVPIILSRDRPDSYRPRDLLGDLGVRGYGELEGVSFNPRPVFAAKILWLTGVEDMLSHGREGNLEVKSEGSLGIEEVQLGEWLEGQLGRVPSRRREVDQQKHGDGQLDKQTTQQLQRPGWEGDGLSRGKQQNKEKGERVHLRRRGRECGHKVGTSWTA